MKKIRLFISAAESSSDLHASYFLKSIRELAARESFEVEAIGIGGANLRKEGLRAIVKAESLLSMGFVEVVARFFSIFKALSVASQEARAFKPDVAVLCDYPEFHFLLAKRFKKMGIPTVCYIPPKVWVWRSGRVVRLKQLYDRVLSILPFEEEVYQSWGVPFRYVGNPLLDEIPMGITREEARQRLGIETHALVLLLMPGSRPAEVRYHWRVMLEAAIRLKAKNKGKKWVILVPLPVTMDIQFVRSQIPLEGNFGELDIRFSQGDATIAMRAADVGVIKSGTSTLEAALMGCPHVVVYQAHPMSQWIFKRIVRYRGAVSLTNLIGDPTGKDPVVHELLGENFSVEQLERYVTPFLDPQSIESKRFMEASKRIQERLRVQGSPSELVAREVIDLALSSRDGK